MRKLCKCGCRNPVIMNRSNRYNDYLRGHQNKGKNNPNYGLRGKDTSMYGKIHTEESKRKMRESTKGQKHSDETKKRMSIVQTGRIFSEEHKKRISKSAKGRIFSKESILKMSIAQTGRKHSEETKRKISIGNKGKKLSEEHKRKIGLTSKGRIHSEETKKKIGLAHKGEKSHLWKGGIGRLPYPFDFDKELRNLVRKRDSNKCQLCSKRKYKRDLDVHHIDYDKENSNSNNLISLCKSCHTKTNHNGRSKWTRLFQRMINKNIRIIK